MNTTDISTDTVTTDATGVTANIIPLNPPTITTSRPADEPITMSSREIAELLGNRHDNVKTTVRRLVYRGIIGSPALQEFKNSNGVTGHEFLLDKRSSLIVVAQLSPEFTARVVDRWQELEAQVAALRPTLPDFTDPAAAAIAWAEAYREKEAAQKALASTQESLAIAGPKADAYDAFLDSNGLRPIRDVSKMVEMRPSDLTAALKKKKAIYKDGKKWKPTAAFAARGYAKMVPMPGPDGRFFDHLYLTPKGVEWVVETFGPKFN